MTTSTVYITEQDRLRLEECLWRLQADLAARDGKHLRQLKEEIDRAQVFLSPEEVPGNVVTMNSRFTIKDLDTEQEVEYTLVYPAYAAPDENRISVLAPLGAALLGSRVGDTITWENPKGTRKVQVLRMAYQPEAAGDYNR